MNAKITPNAAIVNETKDAPKVSADFKQKLLAGIDAGNIQKLPGMGREQVSLNQFLRSGLSKVSNKSFIRSEVRHAQAFNGTYMLAYDSPDNICASCKRTLGELFDYTAT